MVTKMATNNTITKSFLAAIASLLLLSAFNAAHAQPFAYIGNQNSNSVSLIDTATNIVVATVPMGVLGTWLGNKHIETGEVCIRTAGSCAHY